MPRILCFLASLGLTFSACAPKEITPEERLQNGKWVIHNVNELQRNYGTNPIKDAYMEFNEDGVLYTKYNQAVEKGKWSLNADKTHIYIVGDSIHANGLNYNDSLEFKFSDERTLIIRNRGASMEFRKQAQAAS